MKKYCKVNLQKEHDDKASSAKMPVSDKLHKQRVQNVAGTMAIEGLTLSDASRHNLDRYAGGQASYKQILAEIKTKYYKAE